jgi:cytochrome c oxidase subunit 2
MTFLAVSCFSLVALAGCSSDDSTDLERLAMPDPATVEGESILSLWQGAWIAALITGAIVWALIFYAVWHFRRRSDDEIPVQTRYNLPLEIFYTIFPIIMVVVFFSHTVRVQNEVLDDSTPDNTITVVGQQWTWTFNHPYGPEGEENVWEGGSGDVIPTLVLPVDETTRFELRSPDVIHNFGIPGFVMRMDVMPGQENHYQVTPNEIGEYAGKCYELCGVYHSRMLFNVEVVSRADYDEYLDELEAEGHLTDDPIIGGSYADQQVGIEDGEAE